MPIAYDKCDTRPPHIEAILNGLDRYNPETTTVFQEYVMQQCEEKTFDVYACLALLKLYQFNPHLLHAETTTNILMKALTVFPSPAFSLSLALLPPSTTPFALSPTNTSANGTDQVPKPISQSTDFTESIQKLTILNTLLESAQYTAFWSTLNSDDLYADLAADIAGFEELVRIRIAVEVGKAYREISMETLSQWLDLKGAALEKFVGDVCGWKIGDGGKKAEVPKNRENEAKSEVKGERVGVDMFGRVLRRGFEQPA